MEVSAAAPLMFDGQLSVGMALRAQGRSAVKRADPVGRYGSFDMEIAPGATYAIDEDNIVGLVLRYRLTPAKAALVSASETPVGVALLNGLGNYRSRRIGEAVGKESLKYSSNRFGLDLQYNRIDADRQWLVEFSFDKGATRIKEHRLDAD